MLLVSDDVICGFGRLGHMFGAQRFGYQPDMITMAKGLTSGYAPLGGVMISDRIAEPFLADGKDFIHGFTFGGHPAAAAVALANLDILEREDVPGRVRMHADAFRGEMAGLCDMPIVVDLRGDGYLLALELDAGGPTESAKAQAYAVQVCKFLTMRLYELGLTCRAAAPDAVPYIQLSPPLIAGPRAVQRDQVRSEDRARRCHGPSSTCDFLSDDEEPGVYGAQQGDRHPLREAPVAAQPARSPNRREMQQRNGTSADEMSAERTATC